VDSNSHETVPTDSNPDTAHHELAQQVSVEPRVLEIGLTTTARTLQCVVVAAVVG